MRASEVKMLKSHWRDQGREDGIKYTLSVHLLLKLYLERLHLCQLYL